MSERTPLPQGQKTLLEMGPLILFLGIIYLGSRFGLTETNERFFWATLVLVPLSVLSLIYIWWKERETPWILLIATVFLVVFGSMTIVTGGDAFWLKVKLTVVSLIYAAGLGITWAMGFPLLKKLFGKTMEAEDAVWLRAALIMAVGSLAAIAANEIAWVLLSPEAWAGVGKIGLAVLNMAFTIYALYPIIREAAEKAEGE